MKRWMLRLTGALAVGGGSLAFGVIGASPARADTNLVGWTSQADANVVDFVIDNASGLAGSHPLTELDIPEDFSTYQTGPLGYSLASLVWPGAVGGNLGSLLGEAGVPSQLAPVTDMLNDQARAASFYPAGPADSTFPSGAPSTGALEMTSHAGANGSSAKAAVADLSIPSMLDVQALEGNTTATAADTAKSTATGSFHSLSLMGGVIQIGASASSASAQSDGNSPSGTATSHIGAVTVAGQQVSIGTDGLVVGPASAGLTGPLSSGPVAAVSQLVSMLNLKITPLPQVENNQGGDEQITSAGLQVSFSLPSNLSVSLNCSALEKALPSQLASLGILCTLPDVLQGMSFTLTVGRVTAEAIAAPPFAISLDQAGLGLVPSSIDNSGGTTAGTGELPIVATATTSPPASPGAGPQAIRRSSPVSLSSPIGVGLVLALLAVAAAFGLGLRRLTGMLGAPAADQCPLEDAP